MKKLGILLLILMLICSAALTISAEDEIFSVGIRGNSHVKTGDTVVYTVEIAVEKENVKLAAVDAYLAYDPSFFEYVDAACKTTLDEWDLPIKKASDGEIEINASTDSDELDAGIAKGTSIVYEITLKIIGTGDATGKLEVTESYGSYLDGNSSKTEQGQNGSLSVGLIKQLSTPEGLTFDQATKIASWSAVTGAESYEVQLYKDGQKVGEVVSTSHTTYDFSSLIEGSMGGLFTFTVKATSSDPAWEASAVSQPCQNGVKHKGKLDTPSIKITLDKIGGKVNYVITDSKNDPDLVSTYIIYIYEKDAEDPLDDPIATSVLTGSVPVDGTTLVPGKQYTFVVQAMSNTETDSEIGNDNSGKSEAFGPITADNIKSLKVKNPPKLSYTEGETLNLSAMVITVTYGSGATEDVTFTHFADYGITVDLKNGTDVTMGMNGRSLKVNCGSIAATGSLTLTVKSAACQHGNIQREYEPATCGTDGYDRQVCGLCGVKVSEQILEKTGAHAYGEWVVDLEPTDKHNGLRHRDCTVCGHHVNESIPMIADTTADTSEPEDSSDLPETTPDETDLPPQTGSSGGANKNPLGGVKDLGRIFLTILIVIVVLIVLFIILAIWLESRRNRRRRSRARTNQARNRNGSNRGNHYR